MSISVVIATKNEERIIAECLEAVRWADEIVIVDDMSTDRTVELCRRYTDKVFTNDSGGSFHVNKNLGLEKASGEWILSLDADEIVTPELGDEIRAKLAAPGTALGWRVNRRNFFLGRWIRGCGWYPDYIIRLFRRGAARWPLNIHETPQIAEKNRVADLAGPLLHYSYYSLEQYFAKFNSYTTRLAREEWERGRRVTALNAVPLLVLRPLAFFVRKYLFLRGFRDGLPGLFISVSSGLVLFTTYVKLWELQHT